MLDPSSLSNLSFFVTDHYNIDWNIDFDNFCIIGYVSIKLTCLKETNILNLDTKGLQINKVSACISGGSTCPDLSYKLCQADQVFGSKLEITFSSEINVDQQVNVEISYATGSDCSALQWMKPEQTCGGKAPYLFSQCQAIHARSLFPCQDSPSVKATYSAEVTSPVGIQVLMSAIKGDSLETNGKVRHKFEQKVPIPSYLLAIAAGNLVKKDITDKMAVWSEPEMVESCRAEFEDCGSMMGIAERLCDCYVWGRYDMLVLPPSFPYGGMENPCLTFLTPTLIAGDKTLVDVVAHELSHSWTGNLVTNTTWEHFWLNEGHTVYLERLIGEQIHGSAFRHLSMHGGWTSLKDEVENVRGSSDALTKLIPDLKGVDPDDAFSRVPYEKGSALLYYLETLVGQPIMLSWLKAYFAQFARKSLDSDQWKEFFLNYLKELYPDAWQTVQQVDWEAWFYNPGMPPVNLLDKLDATLLAASISLAETWLQSQNLSTLEYSSFNKLHTTQKSLLFERLLNAKPLPHAKLAHMNSVYKLDSARNSEVIFRWYRLCLKARYPDVIDQVLKFLDSVGRMKFARPLYRDLFTWTEKRQIAVNHFEQRRQAMHPITAQMVARDVAKTEN